MVGLGSIQGRTGQDIEPGTRYGEPDLGNPGEATQLAVFITTGVVWAGDGDGGGL